MSSTIQSLGIDKMTVEDRIQLVVAIWDSIAEDTSSPLLTEAQKVELDRRLEDKKAHPDDFVSWEQVRSEAMARLRR